MPPSEVSNETLGREITFLMKSGQAIIICQRIDGGAAVKTFPITPPHLNQPTGRFNGCRAKAAPKQAG